MGKVCTFCGHRNVSENIKTKLQKVLIGLIENDDVDTFLIGQHGNFDKYATGTLKILKKKYKHIKICLVAAYVEQLNNISDETFYDDFNYPLEAEAALKKFAIVARNKYMILNSDVVVAHVSHEFGGAYKMLRMAKYQNKTIVEI